MPSVETMLCWATPVKVEVLGAHIEAYVTSLPTLNALRMCHRFGLGSHAKVSELPEEVVGMIEDLFITDSRRECLKKWTRKQSCYADTCRPCEHLSPAERSMMLDLIRVWGEDEESENYALDRALTKHGGDMWWPKHQEGIVSWLKTIKSTNGFFPKRKNLIRKHFGLNVWTSVVPTNDKHGHATVAYLKLPDSRNEYEYWETDVCHGDEEEYYDYDDDGYGEVVNASIPATGYGMTVSMLPTLTEARTSKFKRAMRKLDLEPYTGVAKKIEFMKGFSDTEFEKGEEQQWPRLTILTKCKMDE